MCGIDSYGSGSVHRLDKKIMAATFIRLGGDYVPTSELRKDSNRKDRDIQKDPEILLERYMYEERMHMEDRGRAFLICSTKTCII